MNMRAAPGKRVLGFIQNMAVPIGCGLLFLFLLKFVFFIGYVPSTSMEPTIKADSLIFGARVFGELEYGDIIAFKHESLILVKRIAGVPGDVIYVHGTALIVPANSYFVVGDNKDASTDSRYWDDPFVPVADIIAKI